MSNENLAPTNLPTIPEMLRITGGNTAQFMEQVALHIEKLEDEVSQLRKRVEEMESQRGAQ